jgi:soluble lytic murein transglycosylase-like protein
MNHFRRICLVAGGLALCAWAGSESRPPAGGRNTKDPVAQQRQSVSAMHSSLEAQRDAIHRQLGQAQRHGFFLLPAASRTTVAARPAPACDPLPAAAVDSLVGQTAVREGVDPGLLRSVMQQESAFRPCAISPKGALGLMQLMPATAAELGVADPFNPQENLDAGARFLKQLLGLYGGDTGLALGAYNAGPARVNEYGGIPLLPETMNYVQKVLTLMPGLQ